MSVDPKQVVAKMVADHGLTRAAKQMGVSVPYLCNIMKGRADPGPLVLETLGIEKVVTYRLKESANA